MNLVEKGVELAETGGAPTGTESGGRGAGFAGAAALLVVAVAGAPGAPVRMKDLPAELQVGLLLVCALMISLVPASAELGSEFFLRPSGTKRELTLKFLLFSYNRIFVDPNIFTVESASRPSRPSLR